MSQLEEIVEALASAQSAPDPESLASAVVYDLRTASRPDLLELSARLSEHLDSIGHSGEWQATPEVLAFVADLLADGSSRLLAGAVEMVLGSRGGLPRRVAASLVQSVEGRMRSELREQFGLTESHLSHLLREMDEAGLVHREPQGRSVRVLPSSLCRAHFGVEGDGALVVEEVDIDQEQHLSEIELPQGWNDWELGGVFR